VAKIEVNVNLLNSNFDSKFNFFQSYFFILDKLSEGKSATLHTFGNFSLWVSGKFYLDYFLAKSLENRNATLHTFGMPVLQISRASF
jgi:hypothetical protein